MTSSDEENGYLFYGVDGMHRCSSVAEIGEERKAGVDIDSKCGDEIFAVILRHDTPAWCLLRISVGMLLRHEKSISVKVGMLRHQHSLLVVWPQVTWVFIGKKYFRQ